MRGERSRDEESSPQDSGVGGSSIRISIRTPACDFGLVAWCGEYGYAYIWAMGVRALRSLPVRRSMAYAGCWMLPGVCGAIATRRASKG